MSQAFSGKWPLERFPVFSYNRIIKWIKNPQIYEKTSAIKPNYGYTAMQQAALQVKI